MEARGSRVARPAARARKRARPPPLLPPQSVTIPETNPEQDTFRIATVLALARAAVESLECECRVVVQPPLGEGFFVGMPLSLSGVDRMLAAMDWGGAEGRVSTGTLGAAAVEVEAEKGVGGNPATARISHTHTHTHSFIAGHRVLRRDLPAEHRGRVGVAAAHPNGRRGGRRRRAPRQRTFERCPLVCRPHVGARPGGAPGSGRGV